MYYPFIKRVIDILLSFIGIIVLLPLIVLISIIIKIESRGPVLFKQKRFGSNKTFFNMLKFRSMRTDTPKDVPTHRLENPHTYITKVGRFLRKTSLDEIPQIFNILLGQMSIVGPRPALWNQQDLIAERDKYGANDIPVGLTGWAQVNGRDVLDIEAKAVLDGEYVSKIGMLMDMKCILLTVYKIFKSDGVVEGGNKENNQD